jgi:hypothetical protein
MRNQRKIDKYSQWIFAPWEIRNSTICKFADSQAKWRGVLKNDLKFQNEMKYFRIRWNIKEWNELVENEVKYFRMKWNIPKWNKIIEIVMRNHRKSNEYSQWIFAPWETRNSTIWIFPDSQAKWRGVLKYDLKFQTQMKYFEMRWNI